LGASLTVMPGGYCPCAFYVVYIEVDDDEFGVGVGLDVVLDAGGGSL
jgi:hypothetical protein